MTDRRSTQTTGPGAPGSEPTEEEMRAALEAEMQRITPDDVLLQTLVSLLNLGGRRLGLAPGTEGERNLDHAQTCIDGVRALLPLVEPRHGDELGPIRDALSQLQMAYAQARSGAPAPGGAGAGGSGEGEPGGGEPGGGEPGGGESGGGEPGGGEAPPPGQPQSPRGPAQSSGRLWVPGQ